MIRLLSLLCSICFAWTISAQLQTPNDFFPHTVGEAFTPHHLLVDYCQHVAEQSDMVQLVEYGRTYEGRPLILAFVSSAENIKNLEQIKLNNRAIAHMPDGESSGDNKAIVWLNFSIHGNEAAGTESSPKVLYELVNPNNNKTKSWLDNTVVIIDPACNPDGNSRYTNWQRSIAPVHANANIDDIEHHEPWPNGRTNHYYFDLNRDWAWQTQIESQQRQKVLLDWLPHVVADLHEMGHNSSYFFAPAAKPIHKYITDWQKEFQLTIGKNHAQYFDQQGWLYFTKEVFDLFYPSYGDTYPTFNGAIGMTYEQGGSGVAGRSIFMNNGQLLTIADRIEHHTTTALSTVEVSSRHADDLVKNFKKFYDDSVNNPPGQYRSYVIKSEGAEDRVQALTEMLDRQQITYHQSDRQGSHRGFSYVEGKDVGFSIDSGDLIIPANQPKAVLTQVLFDPESQLEDSLTYDITAWSLPYAYGLEAYATTQSISGGKAYSQTVVPEQALKKSYAYIIEKSGHKAEQFISRLLSEGVIVKTNPKAGRVGDQSFASGSYIITRGDNSALGDELLNIMRTTLEKHPIKIISIETGFVDAGSDLGSGDMQIVKAPNAICLSGEGVNPYAYGQVKYYFDQILHMPLTVVEQDRFSKIDLDQYNTLIMPNGRYNLSKGQMDKISSWVNGGGKVIAMEGATNAFADKDGFALKRYIDESAASEEKKSNRIFELAARYNHYSDVERNSISSFIPGAIVATQLDQSHPLASGLGEKYYSLKTNGLAYPLMTGANNVAYLGESPQIIGFVGDRAKSRIKNTINFAVEDKGRGQVIYMVDNPLFRCFWYNGFRLFSNALFLVQ